MTKLLTSDDLCHWGILGMKWGQRRYQYEDGTLTPEGIERYRSGKKKLDNLEKAEERHKMRAAKADYIRATTKNVNKAVRKDKEQARENLRTATTRSKIQKTIKSIEKDLGKTMDELEREYGEDAILGDKNKKMVAELIDDYSDTCCGTQVEYGMKEVQKYLEEMFPKSKESISKLVDDIGNERLKKETVDPYDDRDEDEKERDDLYLDLINSDSNLKSMFDDKFVGTHYNKNNPHDKRVADVGLKALRNVEKKNFGWSRVDEGDADDESNRFWFMVEDQTIGLPLIANYAVNGNSASKIKDLIRYVKSLSYYQYSHGPNRNVVFEIREGDNSSMVSLESFADACEEVLEEEKKK